MLTAASDRRGGRGRRTSLEQRFAEAVREHIVEEKVQLNVDDDMGGGRRQATKGCGGQRGRKYWTGHESFSIDLRASASVATPTRQARCSDRNGRTAWSSGCRRPNRRCRGGRQHDRRRDDRAWRRRQRRSPGRQGGRRGEGQTRCKTMRNRDRSDPALALAQCYRWAHGRCRRGRQRRAGPPARPPTKP